MSQEKFFTPYEASVQLIKSIDEYLKKACSQSCAYHAGGDCTCGNSPVDPRIPVLDQAAPDLCPLCDQEDRPGSCNCLHTPENEAAITKSEDMLNPYELGDPKKRVKTIGKDGVLPDNSKPKVVGSTEGSGGDIKEKKLSKEAMSMGSAPKPAGIPSMPRPAAAPKAPAAPGASMGKGLSKGEMGNCAHCNKAEHDGGCK